MTRLWIVPVVVLVLFACPKKEEPAPPPAAPVATTSAAPAPAPTPATTSSATTSAAAPAAPAGIASADGETPGAKAVVTELKRTSGGTVSLKLTLVNGSSKRLGFGYDFADKDHEIRDHATVGGIQLIDEANKKKYFVVRDTEGKCVCSSGMHDLAAGESVNVWARFPAPPDDVQKISVVVPHFSPMDDVPLSK